MEEAKQGTVNLTPCRGWNDNEPDTLSGVGTTTNLALCVAAAAMSLALCHGAGYSHWRHRQEVRAFDASLNCDK
jgi:hypothetical protein